MNAMVQGSAGQAPLGRGRFDDGADSDIAHAAAAARARRLERLGLLDDAPDPEFDAIVRAAAGLFDTPMALVCFLDVAEHRYKARVGTAAAGIDRSLTFCAHVVGMRSPLHVGDTLADPRFRDHPLVAGAPHIRFYAGAPIFEGNDPAAEVLGTVCVAAYRPGYVSVVQAAGLRGLAGRAARHVAALAVRRGGTFEREPFNEACRPPAR